MTDKILILDFGSQVTQLIARKVRESGVYCEILPFNTHPEKISAFEAKGIILSGGPSNIHQLESPKIPDIVFDLKLPVMGICYGQQALSAQLGGVVEPGDKREFGSAEITIKQESPLLPETWKNGQKAKVWMSHSDNITVIPEGFETIASTDTAPFAIIGHEEKKYYGMQFHPEVTHTPEGYLIIQNFVIKICGCKTDWSMDSFITKSIDEIREKVGTNRVICGLSGGVDSSVAAVLIHKAIGDQLTCIFVDHGLLREKEREDLEKVFDEHFHMNIKVVQAQDYFLSQLEGITDPEQKRKIFGKAFIDVFEEEAKKIEDVQFLAQGTLYPDVIESVSFTGGPSVKIKSHHNVGGLPEKLNLKLIEPFKELFKDEVRRVGKKLDLPSIILKRHPFPGPGLAIRIPGEITSEKADILRKADAIYREEIEIAGLYDEIWQAFAVLLPVKTVGVMGDQRTYEHVCALRAVTSQDGMTADWYPFPHDVLSKMSTRIVNEVKGINRVVYDITSKPPGTIEWE